MAYKRRSPQPVIEGGIGLSSITAYNLIIGNGTSTPVLVAPSATSGIALVSQGSSANPAYGTVVVAGGGTGATTLTSNGVLIGNGTSAITATTAGTNGQVLLGSTSAAPTFVTPTAGTGLSLTSNATTLQYSLSTPVTVANGGTGTSTFTNNGVVIGQGSSALIATTAGTNGQILLGSTSAAPAFVTPTAGAGLTLTSNATTLQYALSTPVSVANGGTGASTLTANGVLIGNGTSAVSATAAGTNGQVLLATSSAAPTFVTPTAGTGLTLTSNATTLQYALSTPVTVANGGTGISSATAYAVICGGTTSTGAFQSVSGLGTTAQVLTSNGAGALPSWQNNTGGSGTTLTQYSVALGTGVTGLGSVGPDTASGIPLISQGSSAYPVFGTAVVAGGGTGATTFTNNGVLIGKGTSAVVSTSAGLSGQILLGANAAAPTWQQASVGTGLSVAYNATLFQYSLVIPVVVSSGGTGRTSHTAYAVICGGTTTTGAQQSVSGVGTSGQVLTSNGASALPTWQNTTLLYSITSINNASSPYTVLSTDSIILADSTAGAITVNFPNSTTTGRVVIVKDTAGNASTNAISLTTPGGTVTFDGSTTYSVNNNYQSVSVLFDAANYKII